MTPFGPLTFALILSRIDYIVPAGSATLRCRVCRACVAPPLPAQRTRRGRPFHKRFLRHASSRRGRTRAVHLAAARWMYSHKAVHLTFTRIAPHVSPPCRTNPSVICKCHVTKLVNHCCIRSSNCERSVIHAHYSRCH